MKNQKINNQNKGLVLVNVLVFGVIVIVVTTALINWSASVIKNIRNLANREQAIQIAEAGVDYYRWHLAHASSDYTDGVATTSTGPFVHNFTDKDGKVIGNYSLTITPPPLGSTLIKIKSKGTVTSSSTSPISRTVQINLAIPSFAKFAVIANDFMNFGIGTEIFGPIHSNNGIHFNGLAHNIITSAKDKFVDPDFAQNVDQMGVYTSVNPTEFNNNTTPPTTPPNRPDVFIAGRQFPTSVVDFLGITTDLAKMKSDAIANGKYFASSGQQGYHIVLKTNDTFDIYKVKTIAAAPNNCTNVQNETGWGTWSIKKLNNGSLDQTIFQSNVPFPTNGVIFVEDHVWVDGTVNTARLTIAAGKFPDNPTTWKNIIVNNDLLYTNQDGQDIVALIAQGDITTGLYDNLNGTEDLRIDAAVIAQNGRAGRYYYNSSCGSTYLMNALTLYGMIGTNHRYGFAWGSSSSINSGFITRNIIYDADLLYAPPPNFPLTSNQYTILSWEEIE